MSELELTKCALFAGWPKWPKYSTTCVALPQEIDADAFEAAVEVLRDQRNAETFITTPLEAAKIFEVAQFLQCPPLAQFCADQLQTTLSECSSSLENALEFPPTHYQEIETIAREYSLQTVVEECQRALQFCDSQSTAEGEQIVTSEEEWDESDEEEGEEEGGDEAEVTSKVEVAPEKAQETTISQGPTTQPQSVLTSDSPSISQKNTGDSGHDLDPWVTTKHGRKLAFFGPKEEGVPESPRPMLKRQVPRLLSKVSTANVDTDIPQTTDTLLAIAFDNELVSREEAIEWMSTCHLGHESKAARAVNNKGDSGKRQSCC